MQDAFIYRFYILGRVAILALVSIALFLSPIDGNTKAIILFSLSAYFIFIMPINGKIIITDDAITIPSILLPIKSIIPFTDIQYIKITSRTNDVGGSTNHQTVLAINHSQNIITDIRLDFIESSYALFRSIEDHSNLSIQKSDGYDFRSTEDVKTFSNDLMTSCKDFLDRQNIPYTENSKILICHPENGFKVEVKTVHPYYVKYGEIKEKLYNPVNTLDYFQQAFNPKTRLYVAQAGDTNYEWVIEYLINGHWVQNKKKTKKLYPFWKERNQFYLSNSKNRS